MFNIYQITNKINRKSYIGFTTKPVIERWRKHQLNAAKGIDYHFYRAIRKYGSDSFLVETLEQGWCPLIGKNIREPYWISVLKPEYNMTEGGDGVVGLLHNEETRKFLRSKAEDQWKDSREELCVAAVNRWNKSSEREAQSLRMTGVKRGTYKIHRDINGRRIYYVGKTNYYEQRSPTSR